MRLSYYKKSKGRNAGFIVTFGLLPIETLQHRGYGMAIASRKATQAEEDAYSQLKRYMVKTYKTIEHLLDDEIRVLGNSDEYERLKNDLVLSLPPSDWRKFFPDLSIKPRCNWQALCISRMKEVMAEFQ